MINHPNLKNFDAAEYLETKEDVLLFLNEAFSSRDTDHIVSAVESVLRSKPVRAMQGSGGNLKNVEQTFGEDRKPTLQTLICIAENPINSLNRVQSSQAELDLTSRSKKLKVLRYCAKVFIFFQGGLIDTKLHN